MPERFVVTMLCPQDAPPCLGNVKVFWMTEVKRYRFACPNGHEGELDENCDLIPIVARRIVKSMEAGT